MTKQVSVKKATYKTQNFYFLLESLLITKALLIAVGTYCYDKISDKILSKIKTFITISRQKVSFILINVLWKWVIKLKI